MFLTGREGESWAIRAGEATEQMSWATTLCGAVVKDGSLLQFWLQGVARRIKHWVSTSQQECSRIEGRCDPNGAHS
jgi:hypothetical protein